MYIVVILFVILIVYIIYNWSEITYVKSTLDNKVYMIHRGHNHSKEWLEESANTLAKININMEILINYLDTTYHNDINKNYFIKKLKQNYNPYMISEAAVDPRYTTYTIDKSNIHICLRTRDAQEKIYDINTLMYVVLHELAHLSNYTQNGTPIIGHGDEFRMIFAFYVETSIKLGIYKYVDYTNIPQEYCGIKIMSTIT
jgi:hypothetical protein